MADNKLSILITADGTQAKAAMNEVSRHATSMGGSLASSLSSAIPMAQTAVAAIGAIGTVVAGVGVRLFEITKTAADFGSEIYDASQKTGLGAEALSSLKAAAETSGSSLENVTKGISKFAKQYKGDAQDLQAELGKVFKQINDVPPGFRQLQLAQEKFGKSGADLIPVIRSFDGDIEGLIENMRELGVTIDDKAAYEADQFGDQMDILGMQIAGVGRTIGTALMPEFTRMASSMSDFLIQNKGEIASWGTATANVIRGITAYWNEASMAVRNFWAESRAGGQSPFGGAGALSLVGGGPMAIAGIWNTLQNKGASVPQQFGPYAWEMSPASKSSSELTTGGGKGGGAGKSKFQLSSQAKAIVDAANKLGISPLDLATIIGFETAGTYSPSKRNQYGYEGLIQFSPDIQKKGSYGYRDGMSFEQQIAGPVVKYLQDRFGRVGRSTEGASLLDLYRTVLGGNPNASLTGTDANGVSPMSGVRKMLRDHRPAALNRFFGGSEANAKGDGWGKDFGAFQSAIDKEKAEATKLLDEEANEAARIFEEWLRAEREASDARISIRKEEANLAEEILREQLRLGLISEAEYTDRVAEMRIGMLLDERDELAEQTQTRETIQKLAELDLQIATARLKKENDIADTLERQRKEHEEIINSQRKANQRPVGGSLKKRTDGGNGFLDSIFESIGGVKGEVYSMENVLDNLGEKATEVFFNMAQGLGNMLQNWVLMGDQADVSMSKMVASVLAGVAAQAATLAIFHVAMGIAALTPWGATMYGPAPLHFKAAALWGGIAVGAALAGRAAAGDSFKSGSSSGGGSSSGSGRSTSSNQDLDPYTRTSSNAYMSGTRNTDTRRFVDAVERLERKIDTAKPGDVFMRGMKANRGAVLNQATEDARSNAASGVRFGRALNFK